MRELRLFIGRMNTKRDGNTFRYRQTVTQSIKYCVKQRETNNTEMVNLEHDIKHMDNLTHCSLYPRIDNIHENKEKKS